MEVKDSQLSQDFWEQCGGVGSIASFGDRVSKACLDISAKQYGSWVTFKVSMEEMVEKINGGPVMDELMARKELRLQNEKQSALDCMSQR